MRTYRLGLLCLSALLIETTQSYAVFIGPPNSNAGIVEKQLERDSSVKKIEPFRPIPLIEVEVPEEQLDLGNETVHLTSIQFVGNSIYSCECLQQLVDPYIHCELSMSDIRDIAQVIQQKYACDGYFLARVFPPEQEIADGTLCLQIVEGCLGDICVEGNCYYKTSFIRKYFKRLQGKPINYNTVVRELLLLNDNTDLDVAAVFRKGCELGTADLVLKVEDDNPIHLYANTNNYGTHITTLNRSGARLDWGNAVFQGDTLRVGGVLGWPAEDLQFINAVYNVPINTRGTSIDAGYVYTNFEVNRDTEFDLEGRSQVGTIAVNQALHRALYLNTDVYLAFDYTKIPNFSHGKTISDDKLRILYGGFSLDGMNGCVRHLFETNLSVGIPDFLGGLHSVDSRCSRVGAGGQFVYLDLDWRRLQSLPGHCFLLTNVTAQATPYKLPIPEQIYIGGVDTVRGYPLAVGLGDNGYYINLEGRTPFPWLVCDKVPWMKRQWKDFLQLVFFVDHGGVFLNGGGEDQKHSIFLTSIGTGFRVYGPWGFDVSFDIGFPMTTDKKSSDNVFYFKVDWQLF